jgi:hypothetical protein
MNVSGRTTAPYRSANSTVACPGRRRLISGSRLGYKHVVPRRDAETLS